MKLKDILKGVNYALLNGSDDIKINDIKYDSRKIEKNDVFVAIKGTSTDGHDYIPEAISKGASVIVVSKMMNIHGDVTIIKVDDSRIALSYMSTNYFDNPASKLVLIGVTGTVGKTATTHIIKTMLDKVGIKCGLIGTIGIKYNNKVINTDNTTPESYEIHKALADMVKSGITHVVIECSSQGFKLNRLNGITFDIGVLTNINTNNIDPKQYPNLNDYLINKNKLFLNSKKVIVNNDSAYLDEVLKSISVPVVSYAIKNKADLQATDIKLINEKDFIGTEFNVTGLINENFKISMPGEFNVYNTLCAIMVCHLLNVDIKKAKESLTKLTVRGRTETALLTPKYKVIIDYAHTENSMETLINNLNAYHPKRLICVFGSGGNTLTSSRNNMGEIIGQVSSLSIVTMDNPRFEEISSINKEIKVGLDKVNAKYIEIDDRADAIKYACENALDGDIVLLIGKGHEEYQDIKGTKYHFSELEVLEEVKKKLK